MSPDLQTKMMAAAQAAEMRGWKLCKEKDAEYEAQLASHNIVIADLNPYVRNMLDLAGEKLAHEQLKTNGSEDAQTLAQILTQYTMAATPR